MKLLCPNCRERIEVDLDSMGGAPSVDDVEDAIVCPQGHRFPIVHGVFELLDSAFGSRLAAFLDAFGRLRADEDKRLVDPQAYPDLPSGPAVANNFEWRLRQIDLQVITSLLSARPRQTVLDIGAWNGWLSNRLAAMDHPTTAIDFFTDEYDGLQARKFYTTRWLAIQMNLDDLAVLDQSFDVVVVNRCLAFYEDPVAYARAAEEKVAPGGLLILTGLAFIGDPRGRIAGLADLRRSLNLYGSDFFKPMKGYLDFGDMARLQAMGVQLIPYPQLRLANLKSRLIHSAPRYYYGLKRASHVSAA